MRPGFHCREHLPLDHLAARALVALYRQACHGARETQRLPRVQDIYRTEIGLVCVCVCIRVSARVRVFATQLPQGKPHQLTHPHPQ